MTDAELSKAVADACGIAVKYMASYGCYFMRNYLAVMFDPARRYDDAIFAAEKCGLFDKHDATLEKARHLWVVSFYPDATTKHVDGVSNESGPRAICEAILAITKGKG